MKSLLARYAQRLESEGCVRPNRVALACRNDTICSFGPSDLAGLAVAVLEELPVAAVVVAVPLQPYSGLLLRRALPHLTAIVPRDSESRSSLHDVPLIASCKPAQVATALAHRKGCIIDGIGIAAQGSLTVEQAYINWSSLYHATFIKYLEDLLAHGVRLPEEADVTAQLLQQTQPRQQNPHTFFQTGPLQTPGEIINEMATVGKATVQMGLVDSFFGNISYAGDTALYISQTSARLDELEHQIDPIPYDNSSTAGITASSELPAHRAIIASTGCRAVLHGHPRFPVVMSFFSTPSEYEGIEQVCGIPVVGGEGGLGGLAQTVPRAFCLTKARAVIVRGHGVFSIGSNDFREAFAGLTDTEQACREEYGRRLSSTLA